MGIVNVTPDSFSDGGTFYESGSIDHDVAAEHGFELVAAGADIIDVGGESTRPGSRPVTAEEELARVVPVVERLAAGGCVVSVDTSKPVVAEAAIDAGAEILNDVTALRDPAMARLAAESGVGVVLMHMQGTPADMQDDPRYDEVVSDVRTSLLRSAEAATRAGVGAQRICLDPGIGFGKSLAHNLELIDRLDELATGAYPVLIGTSRKGFLGTLLGGLPAGERDVATAATVAIAVDRGASVVRVHNVAMATHSARVVDAIVRREAATEERT